MHLGTSHEQIDHTFRSQSRWQLITLRNSQFSVKGGIYGDFRTYTQKSIKLQRCVRALALLTCSQLAVNYLVR